jgi:TfoX/Sxy family transcriptional regulator of competence genes
MNANETGANRVRSLLAGDPRIEEKKMFGGLGFMLNGNMVCGFSKKGELIVRLGKDGEAAARQLPGADDMDFEHKMGGMLFVAEHSVGDDADLRRWIDLALDFVVTLPPK